MNAQADSGIVNIKGKDYQTVAYRIHQFRSAEQFAGHQIVTDIVSMDEKVVVMKAGIYNAAGLLIATGFSEEYRTSSPINRTSALENAETSSIGRALACLGIGGTHFASAEEVARAVEQQTPISKLQLEAINLLIEEGKITQKHLQQAFGVQTAHDLYTVEADRVLASFADPEPEKTQPPEQEKE